MNPVSALRAFLTNASSTVKVSARASYSKGTDYTGCIVALHPSMQGAFTLGGDASGSTNTGTAQNNVSVANDTVAGTSSLTSDTYSPVWTQYGLGSAYSFSVTRYIMIKQQATEQVRDG